MQWPRKKYRQSTISARGNAEYKRLLIRQLIFAHFIELFPGKISLNRFNPSSKNMNNIDAISHVTGRSVYLDDIPIQEGTLYAIAYGSEIAHGKILSINLENAKTLEGVEKIITAPDVPGENQ